MNLTKYLNYLLVIKLVYDQEVAMCDHFMMYDQEFHFNIFFFFHSASVQLTIMTYSSISLDTL